MAAPRVLPLILAGGIGERLFPLTLRRCKPAVPFGGNFRVVDFSLLNCLLSGLKTIFLLAQYQAETLRCHLTERWAYLSEGRCQSIELLAPKVPGPEGRYRGTADAVYKNLDLLESQHPDHVLILGGDHVYHADYNKLIEAHRETDADITVLTGEVEDSEASSFGVVARSGASQITHFVEKPANPAPFSNRGKCLINLGIYCFRPSFLVDQLARSEEETGYDFGKDVLPRAVKDAKVFSCPLDRVCPDVRPYWRDVGTLDDFFEANMDLLGVTRAFELADPRWARSSVFQSWLPRRDLLMARIAGRVVCGSDFRSPGDRARR